MPLTSNLPTTEALPSDDLWGETRSRMEEIFAATGKILGGGVIGGAVGGPGGAVMGAGSAAAQEGAEAVSELASGAAHFGVRIGVGLLGIVMIGVGLVLIGVYTITDQSSKYKNPYEAPKSEKSDG